jgi:hypothetical protein
MLLDVLAAVVAATATATRATSSGGFVGLGGGGQGCGQKRDSMAAIADLLVATSGGRTRPHYGRCFLMILDFGVTENFLDLFHIEK